LIAYNSHPPFDANDFDSLQHLGDSLKRDDATKTGKFGLGFNSVYHWTDVPQILSDNNLLLLDPHHSWSAEIGHPPGGPCWDVVKDREDEAMQNQLRVFQEVLHVDLKSGLDGTAVRIPLRTEEQAKKSKICQKSVSVDEMKKVLTDFAAGFAGGYGVFLKKVEGITVNVDGECVGQWIVINQNEVRT
jgi:sacsin